MERLIGSTPQGALFQFALCLLLYNLIQVVRTYVAEEQGLPRDAVSSELLFRDVRDQMTAGLVLLDRQELICELDVPRSPEQVRLRLFDLLRGQWQEGWRKAPPKKRSPPRAAPSAVRGGHFSAWKTIQAAKAAATHPP